MSRSIPSTTVDELSLASLDVQGVHASWSEGYAETWDFAESPTCVECSSSCAYVDGDYLADLPGGSDHSSWGEAALRAEGKAWRCIDIECDEFGQEVEPDAMNGVEGPIMNTVYPLPVDSFLGDSSGVRLGAGLGTLEIEEAASLLRDVPLCIVEDISDDGSLPFDYGLVLTGGGMDLTWEIALAFCLLGYAPPFAVCELPGMAGYPRDEQDRYVMEACRRSAESYRERISHRASRAIEAIERFSGEVLTRTYTVIALYADQDGDEQQPYATSVEATSSEAAEQAAIAQAREDNDDDAIELTIAGVIEGSHSVL